MHRNRNFDLLSDDQPPEIGVHESSAHGIDLSIVKHDFACARTIYFDGKDRVLAGIGSKDCRELAQWRYRCNGLAFATVNRYGDHAFAPCAAGVVLASTRAQLGVNCK
jgi:hypothetical protein